MKHSRSHTRGIYCKVQIIATNTHIKAVTLRGCENKRGRRSTAMDTMPTRKLYAPREDIANHNACILGAADYDLEVALRETKHETAKRALYDATVTLQVARDETTRREAILTTATECDGPDGLYTATAEAEYLEAAAVRAAAERAVAAQQLALGCARVAVADARRLNDVVLKQFYLHAPGEEDIVWDSSESSSE